MKLQCYGKEDINEPVHIPEDKWEEVLQGIIMATIEGEKHLGDNLKQQCIEYLENLFKEEK